MAAGPDWERSATALTREWTFADFPAALAWVNRVGEVAEQRGHHPDILLHGWNHVRLTLSTHATGGLTAADEALAEAVDALGA
jgi:4a-hydroxytetrahydrobiopterin dehydratase